MKQNILSTTLKQFILLTAALIVALTASYALATWSDPAGNPPSNNVEAPINVSTNNQTKPAMFTTAVSRSAQEMRSSQYCDYDGNNCIETTDVLNVLPTCSDGQVLISQAGNWLCGDAPGNNNGGPSCTTQNQTLTCQYQNACPSGWTKTGEGPNVDCGPCGGDGCAYTAPTIYCQRLVCN